MIFNNLITKNGEQGQNLSKKSDIAKMMTSIFLSSHLPM